MKCYHLFHLNGIIFSELTKKVTELETEQQTGGDNSSQIKVCIHVNLFIW